MQYKYKAVTIIRQLFIVISRNSHTILSHHNRQLLHYDNNNYLVKIKS